MECVSSELAMDVEDSESSTPCKKDASTEMNDVIPSSVIEVECRSPTNVIGDDLEKPFVGKTFTSLEVAKQYYEEYGVRKGFSVIQRTSQSTRHGYTKATSALFVCHHYGSYSKKVDETVPMEKRRPNTSTMRGGCEALMRILFDVKTCEWVVRKFKDDHNHDFVLTPNKMLLKTRRTKIPEGAKCMIELFSKENLPINKVNSVLGGDVIGFNDRACWNHLRDVRQKLDVGDAQWMIMYFQKRHAENPLFYFAIQPDEHGRAVNFFWIDARSRLSYEQFGDTMTFDTTYKTNKYNFPFAPFTGVNHHFQTIQFGCGLLQDETEASFTWLFQTWLDAMGGVAPKSIITDSDPAMRVAIRKVFPQTRHRLCYWHIKMKFGEKLSHLYYKKSPFKGELKKCLKHTYRIEDFEKMWKDIMVKYGLEDNSWLNGLYADREKWVPVYNCSTFFAGMHTTGRSEGVNAFFKDYVKSTTSLKEFVEKFDQALMRIETREKAEDHESEQKYRLHMEKSFLLDHAANIYTRNMFQKFRSVWLKVELYRADVAVFELNTHIVKFKRGTSNDYWTVKLDPSTLEGACECHLFEFVGIPCVHIMKVFSKLDIDEIPEYFINKRWLKGANVFRVDDKVKKHCEKQTSTMRFSHLCREATQWACVAYQTEQGYNMFLEGIRELGEKITQLTKVRGGNEEAPVTHLLEENPEQLEILLDPNVSQTKGRNKDVQTKGKTNARYKRPIEVAQEKKGRKCTICQTIQTHDKRNCPKRQQLNCSGTRENISQAD